MQETLRDICIEYLYIFMFIYVLRPWRIIMGYFDLIKTFIVYDNIIDS